MPAVLVGISRPLLNAQVGRTLTAVDLIGGMRSMRGRRWECSFAVEGWWH